MMTRLLGKDIELDAIGRQFDPFLTGRVRIGSDRNFLSRTAYCITIKSVCQRPRLISAAATSEFETFLPCYNTIAVGTGPDTSPVSG